MCQIATKRPTDRSISTQRLLGAALAQLFASPSWQTFLVVAQEQGASQSCSRVPTDRAHAGKIIGYTAPAPPARTYPGGADASEQAPPQTIDGFEIPPDIDVPPEARGGGNAASGAASDAGGAGAGAAGAEKICPTCTFANPPDAGDDCQVCGLPLNM